MDFLSLIGFIIKGLAVCLIGGTAGVLTMAITRMARRLPVLLKNVAPAFMACMAIIAASNSLFLDNIAILILKSPILLIALYRIVGAAGIFIMLLLASIVRMGFACRERILSDAFVSDAPAGEKSKAQSSYFSISPVIIS